MAGRSTKYQTLTFCWQDAALCGYFCADCTSIDVVDTQGTFAPMPLIAISILKQRLIDCDSNINTQAILIMITRYSQAILTCGSIDCIDTRALHCVAFDRFQYSNNFLCDRVRYSSNFGLNDRIVSILKQFSIKRSIVRYQYSSFFKIIAIAMSILKQFSIEWSYSINTQAISFATAFSSQAILDRSAIRTVSILKQFSIEQSIAISIRKKIRSNDR